MTIDRFWISSKEMLVTYKAAGMLLSSLQRNKGRVLTAEAKAEIATLTELRYRLLQEMAGGSPNRAAPGSRPLEL